MKFTVDFNFENEMIYIVLQSIFGIFVYKYDNIPIFIKEIVLFISLIISIICFYIRKKSSYIENNGFFLEKYFKMEKKKEKNEKEKNKIKEYLFIIFFYFILNIIPFINGIQLNRGMYLFSAFSNFLFIGIIIIGYFHLTKFENHQLFSAIFIFFIIFLHPNLSYNYHKYKRHIFYFSAIYSIIFYYLQGIFRGYFKFAMEIKFVDPFFISAVDVGMNIVKNLLVIGYNYRVKNYTYFHKNWEKKINEINITHFILAIIGNIGYPIIDILNCYYNSPYHQCVSEYLGKLIQISFYKEKTALDVIIAIVNSIFSCIAAEIIILRFCGLEKNTKIVIDERLKREDNSISIYLNQTNSNSGSISFEKEW